MPIHAFQTPQVQRVSCVAAGAGGGVRAWVTAKINGAFSSWRPPAVALDRLTIRGGLLEAYVTGEAQPRRVQDVSLTLGLGSGYKSLTLDVAGVPAHSLLKCVDLLHHKRGCRWQALILPVTSMPLVALRRGVHGHTTCRIGAWVSRPMHFLSIL